MTELYYDKPIAGYGRIPEGYVVATPKIPRNRFRYALAILSIIGMILTTIGLIAGIITPKAWAAGVFVAGAAAFCAAGYLARRSGNIRRGSVAAWRPIT